MRIPKTILALVLCGVMAFTACSTSWIGQAEEIVAVMIPAAVNVLSLVAALKGTTISTQDAQLINSAGTQVSADLQLIQQLVDAYKKADEAAKPGLLVKIQTAMNTASDNLKTILPALHITDKDTVNKISAVLGILQSEFQSLAAIIPLVNSSASPQMVKLAERQAAKSPPMSAKAFTKAYNATMTAPTGNATIDAATKRCKIKGKGFFSGFGNALGEAKFGGN